MGWAWSWEGWVLALISRTTELTKTPFMFAQGTQSELYYTKIKKKMTQGRFGREILGEVSENVHRASSLCYPVARGWRIKNERVDVVSVHTPAEPFNCL